MSTKAALISVAASTLLAAAPVARAQDVTAPLTAISPVAEIFKSNRVALLSDEATGETNGCYLVASNNALSIGAATVKLGEGVDLNFRASKFTLTSPYTPTHVPLASLAADSNDPNVVAAYGANAACNDYLVKHPELVMAAVLHRKSPQSFHPITPIAGDGASSSGAPARGEYGQPVPH